MAVTAEFLADWARGPDGPWLHHVCRSAQTRDRVLEQGLLCDQKSTYSGTALASRPGHVYLTTAAALARVADQLAPALSPELIVRVDARALDPAALSPDEDCCFESWIADAGVPMPGVPSPLQTVRDELSG